MNKTTTADEPTSADKPKTGDSVAHLQPPKPSGIRETIESVVIAFVLAFLFRTFEAEAFVIPTGSMATTLMGMHKDVTCPQCEFPYQVSVAERHPHISSCSCPNCGYVMRFGDKPDELREPPSYKGDRIIVTKSIYNFEDPKRWDVSVFKYPMKAETNYIKRLVGLPNETLRILGGDIFTRPPQEGDDPSKFLIQRKPPVKVRAMLQMVYDNDYQSPDLQRAGWPSRWSSNDAGWQVSDDDKQFANDGQAGLSWLHYRQLLPTEDQWRVLLGGAPVHPEPSYILDGYAYNYAIPDREAAVRGTAWVGDLALECQVTVENDSGELLLELVEGERRFQCRIDVADGKATLSAERIPDYQPTATTKLKGPGTYQVRFANVDDQLLLWINNDVVEFDSTTAYDLAERPRPGPLDLAPVSVGTDGAAIKLDHLRVLRDVYYLADRFEPGRLGDIRDLPQGVEFSLGKDQFLALGDNSPRSSDSRLWNGIDANRDREYYVDRKYLIGKALFVYWPHALDQIPGTGIWFPLVPNVARMRPVH